MTLTAIEKRNKVVKWMGNRNRTLAYANRQPGKLNPDKTGYSDCSGVIHAAYKTLGITLGTMSYIQAVQGQEIASGKTSADFEEIQHLAKPGDILAMSIRTGYRGGTHINHVELMADTKGMAWGHGSGIGPWKRSVHLSWLLGNSEFWTLRRIIPDDPKPQPTPKPETPKKETFLMALTNQQQETLAEDMVKVKIEVGKSAHREKAMLEHLSVIAEAVTDSEFTKNLRERVEQTNAAMGRMEKAWLEAEAAEAVEGDL